MPVTPDELTDLFVRNTRKPAQSKKWAFLKAFFCWAVCFGIGVLIGAEINSSIWAGVLTGNVGGLIAAVMSLYIYWIARKEQPQTISGVFARMNLTGRIELYEFFQKSAKQLALDTNIDSVFTTLMGDADKQQNTCKLLDVFIGTKLKINPNELAIQFQDQNSKSISLMHYC